MNIKTPVPDLSGLSRMGYRVREVWLSSHRGTDYFDGFSATKRLNGVLVEVYVGSDDGEQYFTPQAYVNDERVGEGETPEQAARVAELRAMLVKASAQSKKRSSAYRPGPDEVERSEAQSDRIAAFRAEY